MKELKGRRGLQVTYIESEKEKWHEFAPKEKKKRNQTLVETRLAYV